MHQNIRSSLERVVAVVVVTLRCRIPNVLHVTLIFLGDVDVTILQLHGVSVVGLVRGRTPFYC